MTVLIIYLIGVAVAWIQLQYWFRDEDFTEDEAASIFILSTLSWFIYILYYIEHWKQDK